MYIQKSSDRQMLTQGSFKSHVMPEPTYIREKEISEDVLSENDSVFKKPNLDSSKTSIRIRFRTSDTTTAVVVREVASQKCQEEGAEPAKTPRPEEQEESAPINYQLHINRGIWLVYCICSVRINSAADNSYGWVQVLQAINALAVIQVICFSCYSEWNITPVMAIHLVSLMLTIGFYLSMEEPLHTVIAVCRCVRILMIFVLEDKLGITIKRILQSLKALSKGLLAALLLFLLCCIIGMQLFMNDTTYQCRSKEFPAGDWQPISEEICGSSKCPTGSYCTSPLQYGLPVPALDSFHPNFNSISESIVTMFQLFRMIGWVDIAFVHSNYFTREISLLFFAGVILIGPLLMMNLLLSLLYEGFQNTKETLGKKEKLKHNTEVTENKESTQALSPSALGMSAIIKNIESTSHKEEIMYRSAIMKKMGAFMQDMQKASEVWKYQRSSWKDKFSKENMLKLLSHCLIVAQVVLVCMDRADWSDQERRYVGISFGVCMILWTVDLGTMLIRYCSTSQLDSLKKKLDGLDVVLYLLIVADYIWKAVLGLYLFENDSPMTPVVQPLVCLRIIKIIFENPFDQKLSCLMRALFETIESLLPFMAVILVFVFFEAAVGLQLFHDSIKLFNGQVLPVSKAHLGHSPPLNFDSMGSSFATFAAFMANEEWHNILYRFVSMGRRQLIPFFMTVVIVAFVLSELFLATYINTYIEKVKEYEIIQRQEIDMTPEEDRLHSVRAKKSMFLFEGSNQIRSALTFVIRHHTYHKASIVILIVYVVLLCVRQSLSQEVSEILFLVLDCIFAVDMLLKVIVYGLVGKYAYIDNGTNILDMLVNIFVIISLFTPALDRWIAAIRCCRILRFMESTQSLRILKTSLASSCKHIVRLLLFLLAFLLLAGSISVKLFKSSTYSCSISKITTQSDCLASGGEWKNIMGVGFDNILEGIFNMLAVVTAQGWLPIMTNAMQRQSPGIAVNPASFNIVYAYFFLIVFFLGNFIFINIFVGVLIENMQSVNQEYDPLEREIQSVDARKQEWARISHYIYNLKPVEQVPEPEGLSRFLFRSIHSRGYYTFGKAVIILNTVVLACFYSEQRLVQHYVLCILNQLCFLTMVVQFVVEAVMLGNRRKLLYTDLFLLLLSIPGVYLLYFPIDRTNSHNYEALKEAVLFFKAAQVCRCYKILLCFSSARSFLKSLIKILPKVTSLLGFLLMMLIIGAVLAQDLFGNIRYHGSIGPKQINFDNFFNSIFSLFSITTGEYWYANAIDLSHRSSSSYPCGNGQPHNQCGSPTNLLFFVVVVMLLSVIFMNLLIAVILTLTAKSLNLEESATSRYKLANLVKLWSRYDPLAKGFINYKTFFQFSMAMAVECGINKEQFLDLRKKKMFMRILNIPVYEHRQSQQYCYLFHDVAISMSRTALLLKETSNFDFLLHDKLSTETALSHTPQSHLFSLTNLDSGKMAVVILMLNKYRRWRQRSANEQSSNNNTLQRPTM